MKKKLAFLLALLTIMTSAINFTACSTKEELKVEVLPVKGGCDGIITIVHDDGDLPSARFLKEEFEKNGLIGTFAMIADRVVDTEGNLTSNAAEWQALVATRLFDIANHTQSHTWYGFDDNGGSGTYEKRGGAVVNYDFEPGHMTDEIVGAAERMREVFDGQRVLTYIIPGFANNPGWDGRTESAIKIINDNFISQRNTGGSADFDGVSVECLNKIGSLNFESLNSMMVNASDDYRTRWFDYVDNTVGYNGWGIFCFHNIWEQEVPSGHNVAQSKASELFEYIGDYVERGMLWCATFEEGSLYTKEYENAKATIRVDGEEINVTLHDRLDNDIYNMALTVRIDVFKKWDKAQVTYDGKTIVCDTVVRADGTRYIEVDLVPDKGTAVITQG